MGAFHLGGDELASTASRMIRLSCRLVIFTSVAHHAEGLAEGVLVADHRGAVDVHS